MIPFSRLSRHILTIFVFVFTLALGPVQLKADLILTTYQFTGTCTDCADFGIGMLTLDNYTPGNNITSANFASFSYSSNLFSLEIDSPAQLAFITGMLPGSMPGPAFVDIADTSAPPIVFVSFSSGNWCVGTGGCGNDNGTASTWDPAAPEPASLILLAPALLGFVLTRRRRSA